MGARSKERAGAGTAAEQMRRGGPSRASPALSTSRLPGIPLIYSRNLGLTGTRVLLGWGGAEGGPWEAEAKEKHLFIYLFICFFLQTISKECGNSPPPLPTATQCSHPAPRARNQIQQNEREKRRIWGQHLIT